MLLFFILPPLTAFLINAFRLKSPNKKSSGLIATIACLLSFAAVVSYCFIYGFEKKSFVFAPWLQIGNLNLNFSFSLDSLSLLLSLLITGVGFLIHLYSLSYMSKEEGLTRYFAYLNLFIVMMLILVLADHLLLMFVGWEGVGLCSYLLIGFWFKDESKTQAGMMAFVVNRIGDACFLLGIFLLFFHFGTLHFSELNTLFSMEAPPKFFSPGALGALLLFWGQQQVGSDPFIFLAPRSYGWSNPCLSSYPCRHNGDSWNLFDCPPVSIL